MDVTVLVGFVRPAKPLSRKPFPKSVIVMSARQAMEARPPANNGNVQLVIDSAIGNARISDIRRQWNNAYTRSVFGLSGLESLLRGEFGDKRARAITDRLKSDGSEIPEISPEVLVKIPTYSPIASNGRDTWRQVRHTGGWHKYAFPEKRRV